MSGASSRPIALTGSALGKRTRDESETVGAVYSKKREGPNSSEIKAVSLPRRAPRDTRHDRRESPESR